MAAGTSFTEWHWYTAVPSSLVDALGPARPPTKLTRPMAIGSQPQERNFVRLETTMTATASSALTSGT
ncbi:hypothetical protein BSP239C_03336 [Brevibacterium sp. 239c]|uniref:hypothetical protein n=1 Tax=Brevibacterium sp. 239c TaxID=1965356 RepID=UPI000C469F04|nr:hypothetical protein [Brevibacterium sp. 239c]SMY02363.1 hypothetical protein BSP239C_03336 [Brevibacterium sp. 239c]